MAELATTPFTPLLDGDGIVGEFLSGSIFSLGERYRLSGYCDPAYRPVLEQLREEVSNDRIQDAQVCAYVRGVKVVDVMVKKYEMSSAYMRGSVQPVMSSGKNLESIVVARLVDAKLLSYDTKVGAIWPEYACHGKEETTVAHVMRHEAGLPSLELPDEAITTAAIKAGAASALIATLAPDSPPGTLRAYHAQSRGFLVNEIVRRVDPKGRTIAEIVAQDLAAPLGLADELSVGLPLERQEDAVITGASKGAWHMCCVACCGRGEVELCSEDPICAYKGFGRAFLCATSPCLVPACGLCFQKCIEVLSGPPMWSIERVSSNVFASARALAKLGAALLGEIDGVRLLSADGLAAGLADPVAKPMTQNVLPPNGGQVLTKGSFGNMGLYAFTDDYGADGTHMPGERGGMHGWFGFGGSAFTVHPEKEVSFGFTVTFFNTFVMMNPISRRLGNTVIACQAAVEGSGRQPAVMARD